MLSVLSETVGDFFLRRNSILDIHRNAGQTQKEIFTIYFKDF